MGDVGVGADAGWVLEDAGTQCTAPSPDMDADGDGLPDALEDTNGDCTVGPDETDPRVADTDGDGLLDGDEDVDRDGVWDAAHGELNPRVADTDGDGVLDGDEAIAAVCTPRLLDGADEATVSLGPRFMYVEPGWEFLGFVGRDAAVSYRPADGALAFIGVGSFDGEAVWASIGKALGDAAAEVGGTFAWLGAEHGTTSRLNASLTGPETLDGGAFLARFIREGFGDDAVAGLPRVEAPSWDVRFELSDPSAERSGKPFVLLVGPGDAVDFGDDRFGVGVDSIAPRGAGRLQAHCEIVDAAAVSPEPLRVLVVADTTEANVPQIEAAADVVDALAGSALMQDRLTEVWLVSGAAHGPSPEAYPSVRTAERDASPLRSWLQAAEYGDEDQRLWMNAVSALDALESDTEVLVLMLAAREDVGFREGVFRGRDGHPDSAPLPAGSVRRSLTDYYASALRDRGARLVILGPSPVGGADARCAGERGDNDAFASGLQIAREVSGTFVEACAPQAERALENSLREWLVGPGSRPLSYVPVPGSVALDAPQAEIWRTAEGVRVGGGADRAHATGYLFWE